MPEYWFEWVTQYSGIGSGGAPSYKLMMNGSIEFADINRCLDGTFEVDGVLLYQTLELAKTAAFAKAKDRLNSQIAALEDFWKEQ